MKRFLFLAGIVIMALILRFYRLGEVPPSPNWDEVALGYNAYSILQTGRDEYGTFLPFVLRSFDDYKPALYAYFTIPSIALFGLNTFAVRFMSAVFGTATVLATYFLAKELFKNTKLSQLGSETLALFSSFLLALSPWHIQFSRIAFESNVGLAFNIFAILSFLKGLRNPVFLVVAAALAAVNLYIYQSEKVFTPLIVLALIIIFRKQLFLIPKKFLIVTFVVGFLLAFPMFSFTLTSKEALSRASGVSVFSDTTPLLSENAQKLIVDREGGDFLGLLLDNRRIFYVKTIIAGYLSHYDFNWFFVKGDIARHHAPFMGILYLVELPFLLLGIYTLLFGKFEKSTKLLLFSWFLIAPIPASITSGVPHAVRTLNFLPTFQIFIAIGILTVVSALTHLEYHIAKVRIKYALFVILLSFFLFNFSYYLNQYFIQLNYFTSQDWQYGYKEAVALVQSIEKKYDKIVVANKPHLDQSYMFFLFYLKYPPSLYQKEAKDVSGGFRENHAFGKYEFRPIEWEKEEKSNKILYVGRSEDFPPVDRGTVKVFNFLDGMPAIKITEG